MTTQDEIRKRARTHIIAFIAVLVLALMSAATVLSDETTRPVVFVIAAVQVLIVLNQMMHAFREGPWVKWLLAFCAVSAIGLAVSLYVAHFDTIEGTHYVVVTAPEAEPGDGAGSGGGEQ